VQHFELFPNGARVYGLLPQPIKWKMFCSLSQGISRSASIVIGYEMKRSRSDYQTVLSKIRQSRSFIMPNIGFQAQLHEFQRLDYSLDKSKYKDFNSIQFIKDRLPKMLKAIKRNYDAYTSDPDEVDEDELFEVTLYTHQVHKLRQKDKLSQKDIEILKESIAYLRKIQVEFVENEASLRRFDIMFREKTISQKKNSNYTHLDSMSTEQEMTIGDTEPTRSTEKVSIHTEISKNAVVSMTEGSEEAVDAAEESDESQKLMEET